MTEFISCDILSNKIIDYTSITQMRLNLTNFHHGICKITNVVEDNVSTILKTYKHDESDDMFYTHLLHMAKYSSKFNLVHSVKDFFIHRNRVEELKCLSVRFEVKTYITYIPSHILDIEFIKDMYLNCHNRHEDNLINSIKFILSEYPYIVYETNKNGNNIVMLLLEGLTESRLFHFEVIKYLISTYDFLDLKDTEGITTFMKICEYGSIDLIRYSLSINGHVRDQIDSDGNSPLLYACCNKKNINAIEMFLKSETGHAMMDINQLNNNNETVLLTYISHRVKLNTYKETTGMYISRRSDYLDSDLCLCLIKHGINLEQTNIHGQCVLSLVSDIRYAKLFKLIVQNPYNNCIDISSSNVLTNIYRSFIRLIDVKITRQFFFDSQTNENIDIYKIYINLIEFALENKCALCIDTLKDIQKRYSPSKYEYTCVEFNYSAKYFDTLFENIVIGKGHKIYNKPYYNGASFDGYFVYNKHTLIGTSLCFKLTNNFDEEYICKYKGEFKDYLAHGKGVFEFENSMFIGNLKNDTYDGYGEYLWHSGQSYKGNFSSDKFNGQGLFIDSKNNIYEGHFVNDKRDGYGKLTYADGTIEEGLFINNKYIPYNCPICRTSISLVTKYVHVLNLDDTTDDECPVCLNSENIEFMITNCRHKICKTCIDQIVFYKFLESRN